MFGLLTRAGYSVGAFGKVTNDQGNVLQKASEWDTMEYIDSPVNYNSFMGLPCESQPDCAKLPPSPPDSVASAFVFLSDWRKFPNGTFFTEQVDQENPEFGTPYQTTQIGNRTLRWMDAKLKEQAADALSDAAPKPFFDYIGPHAPHYPAQPAPWYENAFPDVTIPVTVK